MSEYTKYTKEMLEPLVADSVSVAEVLRKLGKKQTGSISTHLSKVIKKFEIDTSHFLGQAANRGDKHKGGPEKKSWEAILVFNQDIDRRERPYVLRRALIESGLPYACAYCGNEGVWLGKPLRLQVNHRNSDWRDNRRENLEFTCPNCHSQTEGWSGGKGGTDICSNADACRRRRKKTVQVAE